MLHDIRNSIRLVVNTTEPVTYLKYALKVLVLHLNTFSITPSTYILIRMFFAKYL